MYAGAQELIFLLAGIGIIVAGFAIYVCFKLMVWQKQKKGGWNIKTAAKYGSIEFWVTAVLLALAIADVGTAWYRGTLARASYEYILLFALSIVLIISAAMINLAQGLSWQVKEGKTSMYLTLVPAIIIFVAGIGITGTVIYAGNGLIGVLIWSVVLLGITIFAVFLMGKLNKKI